VAINALFARIGTNRQMALAEIEKIDLFLGESRNLTSEIVASLTGSRGEIAVNEFIANFTAQKFEAALMQIKRLVDDGMEPIALLRFLGNHLQKLYQAKLELDSGEFDFEEIVKKQTESPNPFNKIIFNRRVGYGLDFLTGYASHLGPQYLFFQGDTNPRHNGANSGVLYIWTIPFILVGFIMLWQYSRKIFSFVR
jgi:DNA polymerase III delta subunit